jgi:hypothetical protein
MGLSGAEENLTFGRAMITLSTGIVISPRRPGTALKNLDLDLNAHDLLAVAAEWGPQKLGRRRGCPPLIAATAAGGPQIDSLVGIFARSVCSGYRLEGFCPSPPPTSARQAHRQGHSELTPVVFLGTAVYRSYLDSSFDVTGR